MDLKKRRTFSSEFKAKVAIESLKERLTTEEICKKYEIHPTQLLSWKKAFIENANMVFEADIKQKKSPKDDIVQQLYAQIGELKVANDWLKKKLL
jgi:transposase-like protein